MTESIALRLLFVTPRYAPFVGGIETHTAEVARRLAGLGNAVTVLTTDPEGNLPPIEVVDDVHVVRVRAWPPRGDYYLAPAVYGKTVAGGWDIVHCQGYHTLVPPLAMIAALRSRTPYVLSFHSGGHSSRLRNAIRPIQTAALRPLLARASRLIAVSQAEGSLFQDRLHLPANRFEVVPNGSSLPHVPVTSAETNGKILMSIGRLERYKGHQRVIAALPHVRVTCPDVTLQIVGSGPYEGTLRALIGELGLEDVVTIRSVAGTDREAMARLISKAALVTLLSEYEAHPISVMESLALKRPVLAAYTSGLAELADRGLVRALPLESSPQTVAAAIVDSLRNPPPPVHVTLPTWDDCALRLQEIYRDVLGRTSCES